jgi:hypothetical protein
MIGIVGMEPVDCRSSPDAKIALFRSLFRGRDDVYPRRFESRRKRSSGYAPECGNEWIPGICEKPRIKCADCPHRRFLNVTDDVIRWRISGRDNTGQPFGGGVYPNGTAAATLRPLAFRYARASATRDAVISRSN